MKLFVRQLDHLCVGDGCLICEIQKEKRKDGKD